MQDNAWEAMAFLAVLQGLTEFLPISSSAHLLLLADFLAVPQWGLTVDIFLHLGTLCALIIYFRADLLSLFSWQQWRSHPALKRRWGQWILATLPVIIAGFLFKSWIEQVARSTLWIAWTSILFGLLLGLALWLHQRYRAHHRPMPSEEHLPWRSALLIGLAQCCALIPGVSRSGVTLSAGLALGMQAESAARFSFYLSIPVILGANILHFLQIMRAPVDFMGQGTGLSWPLLCMGALISGLVGYLAISVLLRLLAGKGLWFFVFYRVLLGLVLLYSLGC